ncbi:MAG: hypothetical protein AAGA68_10645 [Pseudomonadota bacterium]
MTRPMPSTAPPGRAQRTVLFCSRSLRVSSNTGPLSVGSAYEESNLDETCVSGAGVRAGFPKMQEDIESGWRPPKPSELAVNATGRLGE